MLLSRSIHDVTFSIEKEMSLTSSSIVGPRPHRKNITRIW